MNPEDILEALDEQQRAAAEAILGPVCILAGAGAGKTRTITHRIAYGLAAGYYSANRVMALTYTNRAAGELRARLRSLGYPGVSVKTFHAAALSQLQFFWPQYAGIPAPQVLESKAKALSEAATTLKLRLDTTGIRSMAAEIEWRKFSMLSLDDYAAVAEARSAALDLTPEQNLEIQRLYEENKVGLNRLDWEDVLILNLGLLRAESRALEHVHQQYRFYTVDEYQDISPLQHALLDEWIGDRSELCVVGDPNQTIYSFTGATSKYLQEFSSRFPEAKVVELNHNYRSTEEIVQVANRVIDGFTNMDALVSSGEHGPAPMVLADETVSDEALRVAADIRKKLEQGVPAREIAVLYRVNGQSEAFESALTKFGIDYQVRGGERFFSRQEIQMAIQLVRAESAAPRNKSMVQVVSDIARSLGWSLQPPTEEGVVREKWEALNSFVHIADELPEDSTIVDFAKEIEERVRSQHEPQRAAVTLSTIHAAKGLEWDVVYMVGVNEGYLPISYAKTEVALAEERRLLYVGVTRARKQLSLSHSKRDSEGGRTRTPSRFLQLLENRS